MIEYEQFERLRVQDRIEIRRIEKLYQLDVWNNDFMMFI